jgi:antirestriction protein ArdC
MDTKIIDQEQPAQKKTQTQQIVEQLEKGVSEVFESDQYKQYLQVMSKFHSYSYNNILLIAMQCPGATMVAGYESWQRLFKRHVSKGEKAIKILAPCPYKKVIMQDVTDPITHQPLKNSNGEVIKEKVQITIPAFRPVSVFDVSQTEGEPLPEMATVQELIGEVDGFDTLQEIVESMAPCAVYHKDIEGSAKGYYSPADNQIVIKNGLSQQQEIKTMIHEIAHSLLHNSEKMKDKKISRNDMEVQAESVAYTVCSALGIDTSDYSFGYIAGWSNGKDIKELKNALDLICDTSSSMIFHIENKLTERYEEKYGKNHGEAASIEIMGELEKAGKRKGMHM